MYLPHFAAVCEGKKTKPPMSISYNLKLAHPLKQLKKKSRKGIQSVRFLTEAQYLKLERILFHSIFRLRKVQARFYA